MKPKTAPRHVLCMYNTQNDRRNSDMIILMFPSTEMSHQDGTVAYEKEKRKSDIINKQNINPSKEFTLFYIWLLCQILKNMAILRFDLGISLPRSQVRSVVKAIHETNEPTYSYCFYFVQIGPCIRKSLTIYHLTLQFQGQGQSRIQGICISWFSGHADVNRGKNIQ